MVRAMTGEGDHFTCGYWLSFVPVTVRGSLCCYQACNDDVCEGGR